MKFVFYRGFSQKKIFFQPFFIEYFSKVTSETERLSKRIMEFNEVLQKSETMLNMAKGNCENT